MSHDCRVVTISTNHIMISIMTQFPFLASSEFLFTRVFVITVGLNNELIPYFRQKAHSSIKKGQLQYIWIILTFIW